MSKKNIQMQVLRETGYDELCPVPAEHASSHGKNGADPITPDLIGAQSEIPIRSGIPDDANIWIDPSEDGDGSWYTKEETNGLLSSKADLDSNGKVLSTQLPDMDYIPNSAKGANNGVATLDNSGKVPSTQLPAMNYAPSTHASQHATGGSDQITPASIGAATSDHTHSNYAASSHNHAASNITSGTLDPARIPTLSASKVTTGTFAATDIKAANGTDYTTARIRNIQASTIDLTAGSSSLANGDIYLVYE